MSAFDPDLHQRATLHTAEQQLWWAVMRATLEDACKGRDLEERDYARDWIAGRRFKKDRDMVCSFCNLDPDWMDRLAMHLENSGWKLASLPKGLLVEGDE